MESHQGEHGISKYAWKLKRKKKKKKKLRENKKSASICYTRGEIPELKTFLLKTSIIEGDGK